ncbi:hypothetical protein D3C87_1688100 [compost metagenome]
MLFRLDTFVQIFSRLIVGILRHQFTHHGQLQQIFFEGVDARFGDEQCMKVFGQALPVSGEVFGVTGLCQALEQRLH